MSAFCDSSALVKLYVDERGADVVRALSNIVVSRIARVEVPAALWRKHRLEGRSAEDIAVLVAAFEADWFGDWFAVVGLPDDVLDAAARSVAVHPLRAYDALQLASAVVARAADPDLTTFACFDERLAAAASAEGFRPIA